jgi:tRNA nucleotidyltransferase (CCA-adding enzyme)
MARFDMARHDPATAGRFVANATDAAERWHLLAASLMAPRPAEVFEAMRASGVLKALLPEVDALFGVPALCDHAEPVDVGRHQLRLLDETARAQAPLAVRFAALMHKVGMAGTPTEIWPSHYKHEQRGQAALAGLAQRFAVPEEGVVKQSTPPATPFWPAVQRPRVAAKAR